MLEKRGVLATKLPNFHMERDYDPADLRLKLEAPRKCLHNAREQVSDELSQYIIIYEIANEFLYVKKTHHNDMYAQVGEYEDHHGEYIRGEPSPTQSRYFQDRRTSSSHVDAQFKRRQVPQVRRTRAL